VVIVDLSVLGFIDCSVLGVQRLARQAGGDVLLAAPQERVLRLLALIGLGDVFCVHASVAAAAASGGSRARQAARRPAVRAAGPGEGRAAGYWHPVIAAETGPAWRGEDAGSPAEGRAVSCGDGLPGGMRTAGCADD
jgi:hypothetical protein